MCVRDCVSTTRGPQPLLCVERRGRPPHIRHHLLAGRPQTFGLLVQHVHTNANRSTAPSTLLILPFSTIIHYFFSDIILSLFFFPSSLSILFVSFIPGFFFWLGGGRVCVCVLKRPPPLLGLISYERGHINVTRANTVCSVCVAA